MKTTPTTRTTALRTLLTSSLIALTVFTAGLFAPLAAAQSQPALTIYHSTDPTGADPRPTYAPGCEAPDGGGGGGDSDSGFDSFFDSDSGVVPLAPSGTNGWVVVLADVNMANNPQFYTNVLEGGTRVLIGRGTSAYNGAIISHYTSLPGVSVLSSNVTLTGAVLADYDLLVMNQVSTWNVPLVFTAAELTAISEFLGAGGNVILFAEAAQGNTAAFDSLNQFLTGIGSTIQFTGERSSVGAVVVEGAPFTDGVTTFSASASDYLTGGTAVVTANTVGDPTLVAAEQTGGPSGPTSNCVVQGTSYEELELWVSGGDDATVGGTVCRMGDDGGDGDEICGADITFNLSGPGRFRSVIPMLPTLVIGAECVDSEGVGCILPPDTKQLRMNFRKGEGTPPAGPRRLASLILDTSELAANPTNSVLVTATGEAAGASLQLLQYGKPAPAMPEVIAIPEPSGFLQLLSGALGLIGLCRLRPRR